MLDKFFRKREPRAFTRACAVFVNPATGHTIVVPYTNMDGLFIEQPNSCTTGSLNEEALLGQAIKAALQASKYAEPEISHDRPKRKMTDWPAFKASGMKTLKEFQARYVPFVFSGLNDANIIYEATGPNIGSHRLHLRVLIADVDSDTSFGSATALLVRETQRFREGAATPEVPRPRP